MANEKRLIEPELLKTTLYEICDEYNTERLHIDRIIDEIDDAPDVEVVHGRWEKAEYNGFLRCDQCKDVYINEEWLADGKWNYCPNCGANMKGE